MIYLIITTCIQNRYGIIDKEKRKNRYLYSITETLKYVPSCITPIIVENNGTRATYLDNFIHNSKPVPVIYTTNNEYVFDNKGVNELLDIKEVISTFGIHTNDMIIKLTGRYCATSSLFFEEVIANQHRYDAFIKFYNVHTSTFDPDDTVLGCYALRCIYVHLWSHVSLDMYTSAEIGFARYSRCMIARIKEIEILGIECSFADTDTVKHI